MKKEIPENIMQSIHKFPAYKDVKKEDIRWDCLMGCWTFTKDGVFVGVETNGYVVSPLGKCKHCGYVPGCTGFRKLSKAKRQYLIKHGFEITENAIGDEIARKITTPKSVLPYSGALFYYHRIHCLGVDYDRT